MVDLVITAANVKNVDEGTIARGEAGSTITAGQHIVLSALGKYEPGDVDGTNSPTLVKAGGNRSGVALNGASLDQPVTLQLDGILNPGATANEGTIYVASAAAPGGIAPAADLSSVDGDFVSIIGIGRSDGNIDLAIKATANVTT